MLVVLVGGASGVTVVSVLSGKRRVWIVAKRRSCHGRDGQQDRRDKDQSDRESDSERRSACEVIWFRFHIFPRLNVRFRKHPSRCRCRLLGTSCEKLRPSCSVVFSAPRQTYCDVLAVDSEFQRCRQLSSVPITDHVVSRRCGLATPDCCVR